MSFVRTMKDFRNDESGVIAVEFVLVMPILVWCLLSTFVYFDVYRVESTSKRAALTIADMYSREEANITPAYLNGTRALLRTLTYEESDPDYRVTVYRYQASDDSYRVVWSRNRGLLPNYRNSDLLPLRPQLPIMANGDRAILVQTRTEYDAPFNIGLGPFTSTNLEDVTFETFTVISPRNNNLCFEPNNGEPICGP